jgi:eukaryotic-like serine/threonine-protein kinase
MILDEARITGRIRHPNVVSALDVIAAEGEILIAMDYVEGETLARLIPLASGRGESVPPGHAAMMIAGVLRGLHAAHEAKDESGVPLGIIHRDVSPQNIMIGTDGVARVLDFGVAKATGRIQTTRDGHLKGKLAYMAPEQLQGSVTAASDIYAASVVLWETLTGRRLFEGANEAEVLGRVLAATVPPPSRRAPGVPASLDEIVLRGLDPDPRSRFPTARDMAVALERSVPLPLPAEIGDWVLSLAGEGLDQRAAVVARIEHASAQQPPSRDEPSLPRTASVPEDVVPVKRRRPAVLLAIILVLIAGLASWLVVSHRHSKEEGVPFSASPSPSTLAVAPAAAGSSLPTIEPSTPEAVVAPDAPQTPAHRRTPPPASCDPPWYIDSTGFRRYKRSCFK